jgi:hypothetical protein
MATSDPKGLVVDDDGNLRNAGVSSAPKPYGGEVRCEG